MIDPAHLPRIPKSAPSRIADADRRALRPAAVSRARRARTRTSAKPGCPARTPEAYVQRVARAKAVFGADLHRARGQSVARPVLAADTTLDLDGEIIGKPTRRSGCGRDSDAAFRSQPSRVDRHRRGARRARRAPPVDQRGALSRTERRGDSPLRAERRTDGQGRRLRHPGPRRDVHRGDHGSHSGIVGLPLCETALLLRDFGYPL